MIRSILAVVLGLMFIANGIYMLADPAGWYGSVPGAPETGPLNVHFVRDIGAAFLVAGSAFAIFAFNERFRPMAIAGTLFLVLHGVIHVADAFTSQAPLEHVASDIIAVGLPALLAIWLVSSSNFMFKGMPLLSWAMRRQINAFGRNYSYDVSYIHDVLKTDVGATIALARLQGLTKYCKGVPRAAWYAAKIAGTTHEDCGPCTQLVITMAERDGVAADVLRAILAGDTRNMPEDAALAYRFAKASLAHDLSADDIRSEIVKRWGAQGLVSLAFALTSARIYPTLKYVLGHGRACSRVIVDGKPISVIKEIT